MFASSVRPRLTGGGAIKTGKRWLYLIHRWLGIVACLFFLFWFVSGVVMMYVPYPSLQAEERLAGLAPIDWARVRMSPTQVLIAAGQTEFPKELRLDMAAGEPAWRLRDAKGNRFAVSAVDGRPLSAHGERAARTIASRFAGGAAIRSAELIQDDQWTVAQGFRWARPLWKVALDDDAGTELYVASTTGEVAQNTTRNERAWNWAGAVPHWLYLTVVRRDGSFWRQVVMWTSGPATIVGLTGIWIGILRIRLRRRYKSQSISPYRSQWMKWHHVVGLIGGLFAVTWMASGWLSVNPFEWFSRNAAPGGDVRYAAHDGADFPALNAVELATRLPGAKEARLAWIGGRPVVTLARRVDDVAVVDPAGARLRFDRPQLLAAARQVLPKAHIVSATLLTEPDRYWYSHWNSRKLPALRVVFDDADATWVTLDPETGALMGQQVKSGRTYRWLFNALHDFDLPFLIAYRVVRDPLMWLLSAFGVVMSLTGVVIGWRRLRHKMQPHTHLPAR